MPWSLKFLVIGLIEHFINHDQSKEVPFNYKRVDVCARVILMDVTSYNIDIDPAVVKTEMQTMPKTKFP